MVTTTESDTKETETGKKGLNIQEKVRKLGNDIDTLTKKDISFKISDSGFYVRASKEGVVYANSYAFWCPVEPEKAVVKYSNGLLKVTVPYKFTPEKLVDVKIE